MDSPAEYEQYRLALGKQLKTLRHSVGLSGPELAAILGVSQSKVSKIENGRTTPSIEDVVQFAEAMNASPEVTDELVTHARELVTKVRGWKGLFGGGARQRSRQMSEIEAASEFVRAFQPALVPMWLQTAEYARRSMETVPAVIEPENIPVMVSARMDRQTVLYDPGKHFSFVITEAVLRCEYGTRTMMAAQIDRIMNVATLPNVDVHIVPIAGRKNVVPLTPFINYGGHLVMVETFTDSYQVFDPVDIDMYDEIFDAAVDEALPEKKAETMLRSLKADYQGIRRSK